MEYKDMTKLDEALEVLHDKINSLNDYVRENFKLEANGIMCGNSIGHRIFQSNESMIDDIDKIKDDITDVYERDSTAKFVEVELPEMVRKWKSNKNIDYSDITKENAVVMRDSEYVGENTIVRYNSENEIPPNSLYKSLVNVRRFEGSDIIYSVAKKFYNSNYNKEIGYRVQSFIHGVGDKTYVNYDSPSVDVYQFAVSVKNHEDIVIEYDSIRKKMSLKRGLKVIEENYNPNKEDLEKIKRLLKSLKREVDLYEDEIEVIENIFNVE